MKIITIYGGLGNQMYQYAYLRYLQIKYPNERYYVYTPNHLLLAHNGLEIDQWFKIELPPTSHITNMIAAILIYLDKIIRHLQIPIHVLSNDEHLNEKKIIQHGLFQNKNYIQNQIPFEFKEYTGLGEENNILLAKIKGCNSVAVHIRRNDYLIPAIKPIFEGLCTEAYYQNAISDVLKNIKNPVFYFFSDDVNYVKNTFHLKNMHVVSCNKGNRSFYDLFLMAHCKNMILANSTFSLWAAYLNKNAEKVYCPIRWNNIKPYPNVILDNWIIVNPY